MRSALKQANYGVAVSGATDARLQRTGTASFEHRERNHALVN